MTEIFTRINKDKYNVNFTTDNFDKYLFVQDAARSCIDADAPESGELKSASVAGCDLCRNSKIKLNYVLEKEGKPEVHAAKFCPLCSRKLKGA